MEQIKLPDPVSSGGKPLMDVLGKRSSSRKFDTRLIEDQQLSNLLWAAFGVNRPESGGRTAPSACNIQEMKIYVIMAEGAYVYDPLDNCLNLVIKKDLRSKSSNKPDFKNAPVHLVFMADYNGYKGNAATQERFYLFSHSHAGFIGQNVYLYCASAGLCACFIASFNRDGLTKSLKLVSDQFPLYCQAIGYPLA